jgi:hypothetical protein
MLFAGWVFSSFALPVTSAMGSVLQTETVCERERGFGDAGRPDFCAQNIISPEIAMVLFYL